MAAKWEFTSYAALRDHLEQELATASRRTSRTRDLSVLLKEIIPTAQRLGAPLDWVNSAGISKLRVIIPRAEEALQEGNHGAFLELLELASCLSWRELRRRLGIPKRETVSVSIKAEPRQEGYLMVSLGISRALWETLRQLTRDHVVWEVEEMQ